ncbi:MAG: DUF4145 domain-containing protein [Synergistaceae bacterium]|nr:DUF4145 domain-containing protein [Synergistaceae bacterium]
MPGNFAFLRGKFPELADDGEKAEKYLYADNEVCMFFISRIFDNVVKILCSINGVKNNGDNMAGPLAELFKNKAIDQGIFLVLEMMRIFRNGNAHNKDYSLNESLILLQLSHIVCEWLMETHGGSNYRRKGYAVPPREIPAPEAKPPATVQKPPAPKPAVKPAPMSDKEFVALCAKNNNGHTALFYATYNKKLQGTETLKRLESKSVTKAKAKAS